MQSFKEINLNGHVLSVHNGDLSINGKPIGLKVVEVNKIDENIFIKKEDISNYYPSIDPSKYVAIDSKVYYRATNPSGFITKAEFDDFSTKKDFEEFKKEALKSFEEATMAHIKNYMKVLEYDFRKSPIQNKLIKEFSIFDQVEAILEASSGKPQKLEKIKERLKQMKKE